jgi:hypothetical protein
MAGYSVTYTVVDNATKQIDLINRRIAAMRAPMERLSKQVSRFVDLSGLRKVQQGFEWIGRAAGTVLRTLSAIVPVAGTLFGAASIAGVVKLTQSFAAFSHELQQNADNIGTSTQELQQFQDATRLAGGNANDMTESLKSLHTGITDIAVGKGSTDAIQWFNTLKINIHDANTGALRPMADLMHEVEQKIAALKPSADRTRAATALLGASGDRLVESFRQSHKSEGEWFADAGRYTELTNQQKDAFQSFNEAVGRSETAFGHLGQQVSATLATNFTPLINKISEFVEKHTPDIEKAVDDISKRFAAWLQNVDWTKVQQGIDSALDGLKWMAGHLNDIKIAVEAIAALFAAKWAIGIVGSVAQVVTALGEAGGTTGVGGSGMLGKLSTAAALANAGMLAFSTWQKAQDPETYAPKNLAPNSPFWHDIPPEEQRKYPNSPVSRREAEAAQPPGGPGAPTSFLEHPGTWLSDRLLRGGHPAAPAAPAAPLGLPPATPGQAPASLPQLPGDTSWGDYGTRANNPGNMNYAGWQNASGRFSYTDPQTGGAHTMAVYNTMQEGVADQIKLLERNQQKYGKTITGALHGYAENPYVGKLGVDPTQEFDIKTADPETLSKVLEAQYKIEGRKGSHSATHEQVLGGIAMARAPADTQVAQAQAPPVAAPPAAPPVNGAVDVNITHKNPPPNSSVTAQGTGAVNVAPVKVEQQNLATI